MISEREEKMKICPECNTVNKDSDFFCKACGVGLSDAVISKDIVYCRECQTANDSENLFCTKCKARLSSKKKEKAMSVITFDRRVAGIVALIAVIITALLISGRLKDDTPAEQHSNLQDVDTSQTESQAELLRIALEGYGTVREWFADASAKIQQYDLTDAESMKLNDLTQAVSKLDVRDYDAQLAFLESAKALLSEVTAKRPLLTPIVQETPLPSPAAESEENPEISMCRLEYEWDMSEYPSISLCVQMKDMNTGKVIEPWNSEGDIVWETGSGSHWTYLGHSIDDVNGVHYFKFESDMKETADELLTKWTLDIHLEKNKYSGDENITFVPADELSESLLHAFLSAYIYDVNAHEFNRMLDYIETDVPDDENFNSTLFYQMRKEVTNGFLNTLSMELKDFQINSVSRHDRNTLHIASTERYNGSYEEPFSVWKEEGLGIADSIRQLVGNVEDSRNVELSVYVTQKPEYLLRKSADGTWKFYSYTGELSLNPNWKVYDAKVTD